jgi:hypothetical protein
MRRAVDCRANVYGSKLDSVHGGAGSGAGADGVHGCSGRRVEGEASQYQCQ